MDCPVCPITVKKALARVPGFTQAEVDFDKRLATVTRATTNAGYPSTVMDGAK